LLEAAGTLRASIAALPDVDLVLSTADADPAGLAAMVRDAIRGEGPAVADRCVAPRRRLRGRSADDEPDLSLRRLTYGRFVELGSRADGRRDGSRSRTTQAEVREGWRRLHDAHALVLDAAGGEIRMANPLSAVATPYRVYAGERWWYANCAWTRSASARPWTSMGGSSARALTAASRFASTSAIDDRPDDSLLFHCLVPAAHWWDDIVFT
jgi:hypothetical protein